MSISNRKLKVAVLMGGIGAERQVSLQSGANITEAIKQAGLEVVGVDIQPDNMTILDDASIDVFFLGLHGEFGEDGQIQEILEQKNLVYTGSGPEASRLAFDKIASKKIFRDNGVTVPWHVEFVDETDTAELTEKLEQKAPDLVVKPLRQGSSVGVEIVKGVPETIEVAKKCLAKFGSCMIEEFIAGRDITVGILNGAALPIIEVVSKGEFYDYKAKYHDDNTEYLFDTVTDEKLIAKIDHAAVACFTSLGCRHQSRVDMILTDDNVPYVLEINTLPGFTAHSLLPMAAAKTGLSAGQLCMEIIDAALKDIEAKA